MPDLPISGMPDASALAGVDLFVIVQGGITKVLTSDEAVSYILTNAAKKNAANDFNNTIQSNMRAGVRVSAATSIDLLATDSGGALVCTAAGAVTVNVPGDVCLAGFNCTIIQKGAGKVTLVGTTGMVLANIDTQFAIEAVNGWVSVFVHAANAGTVAGRTQA